MLGGGRGLWPFSAGGAGDGDAEVLVDEAPEVAEASGTASSSRGYFSALGERLGVVEPAEGAAVVVVVEEEEEDALASCSVCLDLSYETRLYGFLFCFALGSFFSFSSTFFMLKPSKFALSYALGSSLSLGSSAFFVGPRSFLRTMFHGSRRVAALVYLAALAMTLVAALVLKSGILALICVVITFSSYLWLMASYIPGGRMMLRGASRRASRCVVGYATG